MTRIRKEWLGTVLGCLTFVILLAACPPFGDKTKWQYIGETGNKRSHLLIETGTLVAIHSLTNSPEDFPMGEVRVDEAGEMVHRSAYFKNGSAKEYRIGNEVRIQWIEAQNGNGAKHDDLFILPLTSNQGGTNANETPKTR